MPQAQWHGREGRRSKKRLAADGRRLWLFKLASTLGRTVAELEVSLHFAEFNEWIAFLTIQAEIEAGKGPAQVIEVSDPETLGRMQELAFFGEISPVGKAKPA